jgi:hypothetical protein
MNSQSGKWHIVLGGWLIVLSIIVFSALAPRVHGSGPELASGLLVVSAILAFNRNQLSALPYIFATILVIVAAYGLIPETDPTAERPSCDGCNEIVPFFQFIGAIVIYGGGMFGLLVLLAPIIPMFKLSPQPDVSEIKGAEAKIEPLEKVSDPKGKKTVARVVGSDRNEGTQNA